MNKYSKAVKTAATVGMSLAMVLSAVTPVSAAFNSIKVESPAGAENYIAELNRALDAAEVELKTVKVGDKVKFWGETEQEVFTVDNNNLFALNGDLYLNLISVLNRMPKESEEYETAKYLYDLTNALNKMVATGTGARNTLFEKADALVKQVGEDDLDVTEYEQAVKIMDDMTKYESFEGNLAVNRADGKYFGGEEYLQAKEDLASKIADFVAANYGEELDKYITALEEEYEAFTENKKTEAVTKSSIDAKLKAIKNGIADTDITSANYKAFADTDAVAEILGMFEDLYDGAEEAKEALDKKNDALVAYTKKASYEFKAGDSEKTTVKDLVTKNTFGDLKAGLNSETFAVLEEYYNDVVTVVYELDEKQFGNVYVDKSSKTIFVTEAQKNTVLDNIKTAANTVDDIESVYLTSFADKETAERYYDVLATRIADVQDALEAITTELKGITVNNLNSKNIAKVEAAEEALEKLTDGSFKGNLTKEEKATVKANTRNVNALVNRMYNEGLTSEPQTEWVELEDGNWDYYENGKAVTKWVASGDNWYYVKNGHMLRNSWVAKDSKGDVWYYVGGNGAMVTNTTIDGCYINSYGAWTK